MTSSNSSNNQGRKRIKNEYPQNPFANPDNSKWGENIWGRRGAIISFILLLVVGGIVFWADQKGLIDWQESEDPLQNTHPYVQPKDASEATTTPSDSM